MADSLQKLAHQQAEIEDKRASLQRAVDIERAILGPDHIWVANSLNDMGLMWQDHDPKVALEYLREAARIEQVATGAGQERRSVSQTNLAAVLREQGQLDEASQILEKLLEEQARVPTRGGIKVAYFLGLVRRDQGRTEQAIALLEQALAAAQRDDDEGAQKRVRDALDPLRPTP